MEVWEAGALPGTVLAARAAAPAETSRFVRALQLGLAVSALAAALIGWSQIDIPVTIWVISGYWLVTELIPGVIAFALAGVIAVRMGISLKTVQNTISSVLLKLGVTDCAQGSPWPATPASAPLLSVRVRSLMRIGNIQRGTGLMTKSRVSQVAAMALVVVLGGCSAGSPGTHQSGTPAATPAITATVSAPPQLPQLSAADYAAMTRRIERRLDTGGPELKSVEAVLVSVGDETQVTVYRNRKPADHAHVYSVTKSVTSILVGIAIDEGNLQLDQTLGASLPDLRGQMSDTTSAITLRQLLTMTAGFPVNDGDDTFLLDNPGMVAQTVAFGPITTPGEGFNYSNQGAHVVAAVLAEAVGQTPLEYARAKLFGPLGIKSSPAYEGSDTFAPEFFAADFAWAADGSGLNSGCCGLKLTAEDMLKIGQLYRAEGYWDGRQVVSADWVHASTAPHVDTGETAAQYGYFWWLAQVDGLRGFIADGASFDGSAGQLILVVPERQLVAVMSCSDSDETPNCRDAGWTLLWELVVNPLR